MLEHNLARAIEACAPGKRVTVTFSSGRALALPIVPEPAPPAPPDPFSVISQQIHENDLANRALVASATRGFEEIFARTADAVSAVTAGQEQMMESVRELNGTLHLPVRPLYDEGGKLIGAQRMKEA